MLLYFSLVLDLSVLSTRISASAVVCLRVLSEVALFLFALTFLVLAFASAVSSLQHKIDDFVSIPTAALSLFITATAGIGIFTNEVFHYVQQDLAMVTKWGLQDCERRPDPLPDGPDQVFLMRRW